MNETRAATFILELRQYTLHRGQRDTLIALFDRELVEPQEAAGIRVVGQFRDLDDPDRFVWLRAFPDMSARAEALTAFYGGPAWAAHRDAANATMIDSDNVLLLRPVAAGRELPGLAGERPLPGTGGDGRGLVIATILHLDPSVATDDVAHLAACELGPAILAGGGVPLGPLVTEASPNTYPRLPVREGERVCVMLARFPDGAVSKRRHAPVMPALARHLVRQPEVLRLKPTVRSRLHG